jgi:hypothetical protein
LLHFGADLCLMPTLAFGQAAVKFIRDSLVVRILKNGRELGVGDMVGSWLVLGTDDYSCGQGILGHRHMLCLFVVTLKPATTKRCPA